MNKSIKEILSNMFMNKNKLLNEKVIKLKEKVKYCLELSKIELENRKNGIKGESTISQLEEVVIPDLTQFLEKLESKEIPKNRQQRYLESFGCAFRMWEWEPSELYVKLSEIHHDYQDLI